MKTGFLLLLSVCLIAHTSCTQTKKEAPTDKNEKKLKSEVSNPSKDLSKFGIADYDGNILGGLQVGDEAPDFRLNDEVGNAVTLKESLKEGPVLLVFYRADWCPYCTKHLAEFQDNINKIKENGNAQVIAISPQLPAYSKKLSDENGYTFPILFDTDHVAMKDYKVFFRVSEEYNEKIFKFKGDYVQTRNGDTNPYLPVPATYVIGQDQKIKFVHYDPNYKLRANVTEALQSIGQ